MKPFIRNKNATVKREKIDPKLTNAEGKEMKERKLDEAVKD